MQPPQTAPAPDVRFTIYDPFAECLYCRDSFNAAAAVADKLGCTFIVEVRADDLLNPAAVLARHRKQDDGQWQAEAPAPRRHRHRDYGVLTPNALNALNAPLRRAVTPLAAPPTPNGIETAARESTVRRAVRYVWAMRLARLYEVFPLAALWQAQGERGFAGVS